MGEKTQVGKEGYEKPELSGCPMEVIVCTSSWEAGSLHALFAVGCQLGVPLPVMQGNKLYDGFPYTHCTGVRTGILNC